MSSFRHIHQRLGDVGDWDSPYSWPVRREFSRILHRPRPHVGIVYTERFLNSRPLTYFDDETKIIRAKAGALLKQVHTPLPKPSRILRPYETLDSYTSHQLIPYGVPQHVYQRSYFSEPAHLTIGRGHLACIQFAGGKGYPRRKHLYSDENRNIRDEIKFRSYYNRPNNMQKDDHNSLPTGTEDQGFAWRLLHLPPKNDAPFKMYKHSRTLPILDSMKPEKGKKDSGDQELEPETTNKSRMQRTTTAESIEEIPKKENPVNSYKEEEVDKPTKKYKYRENKQDLGKKQVEEPQVESSKTAVRQKKQIDIEFVPETKEPPQDQASENTDDLVPASDKTKIDDSEVIQNTKNDLEDVAETIGIQEEATPEEAPEVVPAEIPEEVKIELLKKEPEIIAEEAPVKELVFESKEVEKSNTSAPSTDNVAELKTEELAEALIVEDEVKPAEEPTSAEEPAPSEKCKVEERQEEISTEPEESSAVETVASEQVIDLGQSEVNNEEQGIVDVEASTEPKLEKSTGDTPQVTRDEWSSPVNEEVGQVQDIAVKEDEFNVIVEYNDTEVDTTGCENTSDDCGVSITQVQDDSAQLSSTERTETVFSSEETMIQQISSTVQLSETISEKQLSVDKDLVNETSIITEEENIETQIES